MTVYWTLFFLPALAALQRLRVSAGVWAVIGLVLAVIIGLRYEVGGDWGSYRRQVFDHGQLSPAEILAQNREPAYRLLNWFAFNTVGDVWLVNLVCGALFAAGLVAFVRRLPEPFLALTVAIPYLVIVVAMGYTRQAVAIGLILYGMQFYGAGRILPYLALIVLAALFHRTALIFGALALLPYVQRRFYSAVVLVPLAYGLYELLLAEHQDHLIAGYIDSDYATKSAGGLIRVLLTACFAALYILFRKRFRLTPMEAQLWLWVALVSVFLTPVAYVLPTAADRLGLFFLPLQMVVASHLPILVPRRQAFVVRGMVVAFFGLVTAVWLFMADNRQWWLPYEFWLFAYQAQLAPTLPGVVHG